MIDTHCHLTFPQLADRVNEVLAAADQAGVERLITIGTTPDDAEAARAIAERYEQVYFAAGVHPHYAPEVSFRDLPRIAELVAHPKCVAFGEMGIDYHYPDPPRHIQHDLFNAQLEVIRYSELDKPIVIHCRKAVDDVLGLIDASGIPGSRFVFHCFTEPPEEIRKVLAIGAMVSFTGIVTYKNAPEVRESALLVPDDRIMIETDSPYLTPEPHRKIRPNEPRYVADTAAHLAQLRETSLSDFVKLTTANAKRFYKIN